MDPRGSGLDRFADGGGALRARPRRAAAERDAARRRDGGAVRPAISSRPTPRISTRMRDARRGATRRRRWRRSAACRRTQIRRVARLFAAGADGDDPVGHGHQPVHPRHRQYPLPDRAGAALRPGRPAGHRAAPAARPEQRAGRLRRRADPDDVPGLPPHRRRRGARPPGTALGRDARPEPGPDRGRDHAGGGARRDPRHVRHGREPGDVGPRRRAMPARRWRGSTTWWCRTCS